MHNGRPWCPSWTSGQMDKSNGSLCWLGQVLAGDQLLQPQALRWWQPRPRPLPCRFGQQPPRPQCPRCPRCKWHLRWCKRHLHGRSPSSRPKPRLFRFRPPPTPWPAAHSHLTTRPRGPLQGQRRPWPLHWWHLLSRRRLPAHRPCQLHRLQLAQQVAPLLQDLQPHSEQALRFHH